MKSNKQRIDNLTKRIEAKEAEIAAKQGIKTDGELSETMSPEYLAEVFVNLIDAGVADVSDFDAAAAKEPPDAAALLDSLDIPVPKDGDALDRRIYATLLLIAEERLSLAAMPKV